MDTTPKLLAWHNDFDLRERIVLRMKQHRADDAFVQGVYQRFAPHLALGYRGCAIGCLLDKQAPDKYNPIPCDCDLCGGPLLPMDPVGGWHLEVERQFGIPYDVASAIDLTFENLPSDEAGDFALAVVEAIPVGANLTTVVDDWRKDDRPSGQRDVYFRWRAARLIHHIAATGQDPTP